jgi:chromosomal replication initiation ATPase DnaA
VAFAADVVGEATGVHVTAILHSKRRYGHIMMARKMLVMLCRKYFGMQYSEIAEYIPVTSTVLIRHYKSGVARLRSDQEFADVWEQVAGHVLRHIQQRRLKDV